MGEPVARREKPRDRLFECFLIAERTGLSDPLGLPVAEFDAMVRFISRGEVVRSQAPVDACRSYVESALARGDA